MYQHFQRRSNGVYRIISVLLSFTFIFTSILPPGAAFAQNIPASILNLPAPGTMIHMTPGYQPALIKGLTIYPENPFQFDVILDTGDSPLAGAELKTETNKLVRYLLAALTVPDEDLWVNLSPYEENRIIPDNLSETEMGRDMLAQDYILKQLTASLMYPEDELGQKFWDRVYKKASERFGTIDIPLNTFNKVWIVPEDALVIEYNNSAFVAKCKLKVMLEEDYAALTQNKNNPDFELDRLNKEDTQSSSKISSEVIRDFLIPEIEKEVNEGENFATLRQIFYTMVLATWYKQNLQNSFLGQVYVNQNKTPGIDQADKQDRMRIYTQYIEAFKHGVYNYIKEDFNPRTNEMIQRKYFSGGTTHDPSRVRTTVVTTANMEGVVAAVLPADRLAVRQGLTASGLLQTARIHLTGVQESPLAATLSSETSLPQTIDPFLSDLSSEAATVPQPNDLATLDILNNGIARITIKSSNGLNALTYAHVERLNTLIDEVRQNADIKALVFDGGKNFSVGADVFEITKNLEASAADGNTKAMDFYALEKTVHEKIQDLGVPTMALARGHTIGGGMGIAMSTDFTIVDNTTSIAMPEVKIGLIPDVGGTWFLPNKMGRTAGKFFALTGLPIKGSRALGFGLAEGAVDDLDDFATRLEELTGDINAERIQKLINEQSKPKDGVKESVESINTEIKKYFNKDSIADIVTALQQAANNGDRFAQHTLASIISASPQSVLVTNALINTFDGLDRRAARLLELLFAQDMTRSQSYNDGITGLSAKPKAVSGKFDSRLNTIVLRDGNKWKIEIPAQHIDGNSSDPAIKANDVGAGTRLNEDFAFSYQGQKFVLPKGEFHAGQTTVSLQAQGKSDTTEFSIALRNSQWSDRNEVDDNGVIAAMNRTEEGARILWALNHLDSPYLLTKRGEWEQMEEEYRADPSAFWLRRGLQELEWFKKPTKGFEEGVDSEGRYSFSYFADGELNASYEAIDRQVKRGLGNQTAYTWISDPADDQGNAEEVRSITYQELLNQVQKLANALTEMGVKKGDGVTLYTAGNTIEAKIFRYAAMRIGAIFTPVFPGLSAQEISDRSHQINSKVVLTVDGGYRKGEIEYFKREYVDKAFEEYIPKESAQKFLQTALSDAGISGNDAADILTVAQTEIEEDITIHFERLSKVLARAMTNAQPSGDQLETAKNSILRQTNEMPSRINNMIVIERVGRDRSNVSMKEGRDVFFNDIMERMEQESKTVFAPVHMNAEDPLFVIFTSGSTGKPKGAYHTIGGYLANISFSMKFAWGVKPGERIFVAADDGWITGNSAMSDAPLMNGMHSFLYEGLPNWPTEDRLWKILSENRIQYYKTGVTAVRNFSKGDSSLITRWDLSSIKNCASCAEPLYPYVQAFWESVIMGGRSEGFANFFWRTEDGMFSPFIPHPLGKQQRDDASTVTAPWGEAKVLILEKDEDGNITGFQEAAPGEVGSAFIRPFPSMIRGLWQDPDRFRDTYWPEAVAINGQRWHKVGDAAKMDKDGYLTFLGRDDEVLNVSGHRIGTQELESAVGKVDEVQISAVLGIPHLIKGETPVAFVVLKPGETPSDELDTKIRRTVEEIKGKIARPEEIFYVSSLPQTRSAKILRRFLQLIASMPRTELGELYKTLQETEIRNSILDKNAPDHLTVLAQLFGKKVAKTSQNLLDAGALVNAVESVAEKREIGKLKERKVQNGDKYAVDFEDYMPAEAQAFIAEKIQGTDYDNAEVLSEAKRDYEIIRRAGLENREVWAAEFPLETDLSERVRNYERITQLRQEAIDHLIAQGLLWPLDKQLTPGESLPKYMFAWAIVKDKLGRPVYGEPNNTLYEIVAPTPRAGPNEVIGFTLYAGITRNIIAAGEDHNVGGFGFHDQDFHVPGSDGTFVTMEVGTEVEKREITKIGDVFTSYSGEADLLDYRMGHDPMSTVAFQIKGYQTPDGTLAQFAKFSAPQVIRKPDELTLEEASSFSLDLGTVFKALVDRAGVYKDDVVYVEGAAGGTGHLALEVSKMQGARATGLVSSDDRGEFAKKHGAVDYINRRDPRFRALWQPLPEKKSPPSGELSAEEDDYAQWVEAAEAFREEFKGKNNGRLADVVNASVGSPTFGANVELLAEGGRLVYYGADQGFTLTFRGKAGSRSAESAYRANKVQPGEGVLIYYGAGAQLNRQELWQTTTKIRHSIDVDKIVSKLVEAGYLTRDLKFTKKFKSIKKASDLEILFKGETALNEAIFDLAQSKFKEDAVALEAIEEALAINARVVVLTETVDQQIHLQKQYGTRLVGLESFQSLKSNPAFELPDEMPNLDTRDANGKVTVDSDKRFRFQEHTLKIIGKTVGSYLRTPDNPNGFPDVVVERANQNTLGISAWMVRPQSGRVIYLESTENERKRFYAPDVWFSQKTISFPTFSILGTHLFNSFQANLVVRKLDTDQLHMATPTTYDWDNAHDAVQTLFDGQVKGTNTVRVGAPPVPGIKTGDELFRNWRTTSKSFGSVRVKYIEVEDDKRIAIVTMQGPNLNALNEAMVSSLTQAVDEIENDSTVKTVVFTGGGNKSFIAGADIKEMQLLIDPTEGRDLAERAQALYARIEALDAPTIAAINGFALGGGTELAMSTHLRVATEKAELGQPEINLNIIPGFGGTQRLVRLLYRKLGDQGIVEAIKIILNGRRISSAKALRLGLVEEIAETDTLSNAISKAVEFVKTGKGELADAMARRHREVSDWDQPNPQLAQRVREIVASDPSIQRIIEQSKVMGRGTSVERALEAVYTGLEQGISAGLKVEAKAFGDLIVSPAGRVGIDNFVRKESEPLPLHGLIEVEDHTLNCDNAACAVDGMRIDREGRLTEIPGVKGPIDPTQFKDQVVLVTGGGTGLGKATVRKYAEAGAKVFINGRRLDKLQETADEIRELTGQEIYFVQGDVNSDEDIEKLFNAAVEHFGKVDIVINNAGVSGDVKSLWMIPVENYLRDAMIHLHIFKTTAKLRTLLKKQQETNPNVEATVLNVATYFTMPTRYAVRPYLFRTPYTMAQAMKIAYTKLVANAVEDSNLTSIAVNPGPFAGERISTVVYPKGARIRDIHGTTTTGDKIEKATQGLHPKARFVTIDEVATNIILSTAKEVKNSVNGEVVTMGGISYSVAPAIVVPTELGLKPNLKGKTVIVTGLGEESHSKMHTVAQGLIDAGASVIVAGKNIENVSHSISAAEGQLKAVEVDFSDNTGRTAKSFFESHFDHIDHVIHITGEPRLGTPFYEMDVNETEDLIFKAAMVPSIIIGKYSSAAMVYRGIKRSGTSDSRVATFSKFMEFIERDLDKEVFSSEEQEQIIDRLEQLGIDGEVMPQIRRYFRTTAADDWTDSLRSTTLTALKKIEKNGALPDRERTAFGRLIIGIERVWTQEEKALYQVGLKLAHGQITAVGMDYSSKHKVRKRRAEVFREGAKAVFTTLAAEVAAAKTAIRVNMILPGSIAKGPGNKSALTNTAVYIASERGAKKNGVVYMPDERNAATDWQPLPGEGSTEAGELSSETEVDLSTRTVLVTGGAINMGKSIATSLADQGAKVIIAARNQQTLSQTASDINARGNGQASFEVADLSDLAQVERLAQTVAGLPGPIDLVNNSGVAGTFARTDQISLEDIDPAAQKFGWQTTMDINFHGPMALFAHLLPKMRQEGGGTVTQIVTEYSYLPYIFRSVYVGSKRAFGSLSEQLNALLQDEGIQLINVNPSLISGPRMDLVVKGNMLALKAEGVLTDALIAQMVDEIDALAQSDQKAADLIAQMTAKAKPDDQAAPTEIPASLAKPIAWFWYQIAKSTDEIKSNRKQWGDDLTKIVLYIKLIVPVTPPTNDEVGEEVREFVKRPKTYAQKDQFVSGLNSTVRPPVHRILGQVVPDTTGTFVGKNVLIVTSDTDSESVYKTQNLSNAFYNAGAEEVDTYRITPDSTAADIFGEDKKYDSVIYVIPTIRESRKKSDLATIVRDGANADTIIKHLNEFEKAQLTGPMLLMREATKKLAPGAKMVIIAPNDPQIEGVVARETLAELAYVRNMEREILGKGAGATVIELPGQFDYDKAKYIVNYAKPETPALDQDLLGLNTTGNLSSETSPEYGGINLNPNLMNLRIRRNNDGLPLPAFHQPPELQNLKGFIPTIINITPITNSPFLLSAIDALDTEGAEVPEGLTRPRQPAINKFDKVSSLN